VIDLLVATHNPGKARQFRSLLPGDIIVATLADLGLPAPDETGATIAENSAYKALSSARAAGMLTVADDSGLFVDALDGRPGVHSARYSGPGATDASNINRLMADLDDVPPEQRSASFRCMLTLAQPSGVLASASGRCDGRILNQPRGRNGFGYDPIFELPDGRSMAELDPAEKDAISHRGIAMRELLPSLLVAIGTYRFAEKEIGQ